MTKQTIVIAPQSPDIKTEDLLQALFQVKDLQPGEVMVVDSRSRRELGDVMLQYSTKCFIRHLRTPEPSTISSDELLQKARHDKLIKITAVDDIQKLSSDGTKKTLPEITKSASAAGAAQSQQPERDAGSSLSNEELYQENQRLNSQLQLLQSQLEEYYIKYQELKNNSAN